MVTIATSLSDIAWQLQSICFTNKNIINKKHVLAPTHRPLIGNGRRPGTIQIHKRSQIFTWKNWKQINKIILSQRFEVSASWSKHSFVTGLSSVLVFVFTRAERTSPFLSGYVSRTLPSNQDPRGAVASAISTMSPGTRKGLRGTGPASISSWCKGRSSQIIQVVKLAFLSWWGCDWEWELQDRWDHQTSLLLGGH